MPPMYGQCAANVSMHAHAMHDLQCFSTVWRTMKSASTAAA
jgi:hypothetical protein